MATKYLDYDGFEYALEKLKKLIPDVSEFITGSDLSDTLKNYAKSSDISGLVSSSDLTSALNNYVTSASFTATLGSYVTSSSLSTTLENYIKSADLSDYVKFTDIVTTSKAGVMSIADKTYLDLLSKYIVETNPGKDYKIPLDSLSKFFGEFLNNNIALTSDPDALGNRTSGVYDNAEVFQIWDFDGRDALFGGAEVLINYANENYGGLMSADIYSHFSELWAAYEDGDFNLSSYATKDKVIQWLNLLANDGYYLSWHHTDSSDRTLNFHTAGFDNVESEGVSVILKNAIEFPVVESNDIMNIKVLTSAEYAALATKDSNTMYCITD